MIGFGEAGMTFATASGWGAAATAFDIDPARRPLMKQAGVLPSMDAGKALGGSSIVLSLVTAGSALNAAKQCANFLEKGALWIDMNSVAPDTKRTAAAIIEAASGSYVDAAVLAPVDPARMKVPILLSGPAEEYARIALTALGFVNLRPVGPAIGQASAIKMIRSVMVKGVEALTGEMMAAANAAGVTAEVLSSLDASEQSRPWAERAEYNLERMATHGLRRAEEMEEAVKTLRSLGVEPTMTIGTVRRQRDAAKGHATARDAA
ncbi:NAD(P)-dependent oxidoreductase [Tsuneonella dongtanensis]|uniref:NAD(P)-dependent oxidoreductase n=1 Tax=Tsuneonella dongtanensis TaxID=692370 RepID=UPI001E654E98|nr:DUF1932 domain-containing protein [Tsuneonella dongtanensis]